MATLDWLLVGNGATNPPQNFVGTTDSQPLVIKTDNQQRVLIDSNGNVGIGEVNPAAALHITGPSGTPPPSLAAADNGLLLGLQGTTGFKWIQSYGGPLVLNPAGNSIGIGEENPAPSAALHITGPSGTPPPSLAAADNGLLLGLQGTTGFKWIQSYGGPLVLNPAGNNVGIGTETPTSMLQVAGDVAVTGDVILLGADCAEHFEVTGAQLPEPGTVVVIDQEGRVRESRDAYDKKVAGVISGAGAYRHAILLDSGPSKERRVPLALMGKVYCKVDAQYFTIEVGDLLTTSPTPGHAMKAAEAGRAFGAVIGKALRPLASGQGMIPILVCMQ